MTKAQAKVDYDDVPPSASAMIESMRAYGYSLPMAIADLIDNSITANCKNVWLNFHWSGPDSWISILDDGDGMTEKRLVNAMKLGSQSPLEDRDKGDLGRFGLGMKTASFSQCRRLTVKTRRSNISALRRWDLDFIADNARNDKDQWILLRSPAEGSETYLVLSKKNINGTIVLWEHLDRIVDDSPVSDDAAQRIFHKNINQIRDYLAMIFHRFLEGSKPKLKLFINGTEKYNRVEAWDPFLANHACTGKTPEEAIRINKYTVKVKGFVLPHKDQLGQENHKKASGPKGWNAQQGFYVYRNQRLLVPGSWLGLGQNRPWTKEEHYKLARIRVDIPNSMDQEWQIDVKKSKAVPPPVIQSRLLSLAKEVRQNARSVFAHRSRHGGPRTPQATLVRPWIAETRNGHPIYKVDRNHPLVKKIMGLSQEHEDIVKDLLEVIEETVPVQRIWLDVAENPENHIPPFAHKTKKDIKRIIRRTYEALLNDSHTPKAAKNNLSTREEFFDYLDLIEIL